MGGTHCPPPLPFASLARVKDLAIASIEALPCSVPLKQQVTQGLGSVTKRDTVVVKVTTSDGSSEEDETVTALAGGKTLWTARVSSRSAVRSGRPLELAIDTSRLHFFDPASGESIGHPLTAGTPAGVAS